MMKHWLRGLIDSGVTTDVSPADARYVRFLNTTLLVFGLGQIPVLPLLASLGLWLQLVINLLALAVLGLGFALNRWGRHLLAKCVVIGVLTANTAYFAVLLGSSAPTHYWLIPGAVLGVLTFKPAESKWMLVLVGGTMLMFVVFEFILPGVEPLVQTFSTPMDQLRAAQGSTVFAMALTLVFVGMMHRRFLGSEAELAEEKAQSDRLLRAILPEEVAQGLRDTGRTPARRHEDVSLLFADIVGFTPLAASMPAEDVVSLLATISERFDHLIEECGVEKIKTIGDAYMVAGGVPETRPGHEVDLARCALGMLEIMKDFSEQSGHALQLRVGLHRGPVVAGVIGSTKFAYDLWGESVNLASRLESSGLPGQIHVSEAFRSGLEEHMRFQAREPVELKGVGRIQTHWLVGPC